MNKIVLDPSLAEQVTNSPYGTEVCNNDGERLGFFLPPEVYEEFVSAWTRFHSPISEEELAQAREEALAGRGYTTKEAIAYLQEVARRASGGAE
jgi:hypothetical protein